MIYPLGGWDFIWPLIFGFLAAYTLGSIPFGLILTKLFSAGDIRTIGSGNIGATNVLRTGRKGLAAFTLILDIGKGTSAVVLGWHFGGPDLATLAAYGAVLGHCFPIWLKFKGGKGVATFLGVGFGLAAPIGLVAGAVWITSVVLSRISSVGGLLSAISAPITAVLIGDRQLTEATTLIAILIILRHKENIRRIIRKEEPKIGNKA
jgi:glycerol-3-phosphate acyltransferase PlsY